MSRYLIYATEAEAQRAVDAIDSLRPATETVVVRHAGRIVETREVPRKTWAVPVELADRTWGVSFPVRKVDPTWEGRTVSVSGVPTRIGTRAEVVERQPREAVAGSTEGRSR